jgi:ketosteroid isomerase-like protein
VARACVTNVTLNFVREVHTPGSESSWASNKREAGMPKLLIVTIALVGSLLACGSGTAAPHAASAVQVQADLYAIDQIEVTWHKASTTKDLDLIMSLWADNATFTVGPQTFTGKQEIRNFFLNRAAPFRPENHWISDTLAYKVKATVDGDKGTLYFECHYIDVATRVVKADVGANNNVARFGDRWLITNSVSATTVWGS